eukprot:scaffold11309_cov122-Skeletonema_marinoi.AAC.2
MMKYCQLGALACAMILLRTAEGFVCKSALLKKSVAVPTFQHNHQQPPHHYSRSTRRRNGCTSLTATATSNDVSDSKKSKSGECYYKRIDGSWKPRKELSSLFVGERLFATRLPKCDLLDGKTGPKLFFECGVGKKTRGEWKRRLDHGSFEVCLSREEALSSYKKEKVSASKLMPGEQLSGVVRDVRPYGVFVDVGANRKGLIHISTVAKSQDCYINKEEGLKSAGFARGSPVQVVVLNNEKKRLEFDLYVPEEEPIPDESSDETTTIELKSEEDEEALAWGAYNNEPTKEISTVEADMWAAYAANESNNAEEDDDDDYYDEDEDIEDALGIGSY